MVIGGVSGLDGGDRCAKDGIDRRGFGNEGKEERSACDDWERKAESGAKVFLDSS